MKKFDLERTLLSYLKDSLDELKGVFSFEGAFEPELDIPRDLAFGDLTTNAAMRLARGLNRSGAEVALSWWSA